MIGVIILIIRGRGLLGVLDMQSIALLSFACGILTDIIETIMLVIDGYRSLIYEYLPSITFE